MRFKNYDRKIKSTFMIYAGFESILVPEENSNGTSTNTYQIHIACSYGYKLVCVDDTFIKPFN